MNQNIIKKGISILLITGIVLTPGISFGNKLEELNKQKTENQSKIEKKNSSIEQMNTEKDQLYSEIATLDVEIEKVAKEVDQAKKELEELEESITETQGEIEVLKGEIDQQEIDFKKRLQTMYINSKTGSVEVLLGTEDVDELLSKATMMSYISTFDKNVLNDLKHNKITLDVKEKELQGKKTAAEITKKNLEEKNRELEEAASKKQEKMKTVEDGLIATEAEVERLQAEANQIDGDIAAEKKAIAEAKAKAAREALARAQAKEKAEKEAQATKNSSSKSEGKPEKEIIADTPAHSMGSGAIGWPVPSSHSLTSYYGYRAYPFGGVDFHMGVDISAPSGAAIAAADSGIITYAAPMGTYGNLVKLRHFDGKETYYAHCSGFNVSIGQQVSKGQTIAFIGSTGNSTGPHLHFEVRVGGAHTNPLNYIN